MRSLHRKEVNEVLFPLTNKLSELQVRPVPWSIQIIHREKHRELTLKDRRRKKNQYISALEENWHTSYLHHQGHKHFSAITKILFLWVEIFSIFPSKPAYKVVFKLQELKTWSFILPPDKLLVRKHECYHPLCLDALDHPICPCGKCNLLIMLILLSGIKALDRTGMILWESCRGWVQPSLISLASYISNPQLCNIWYSQKTQVWMGWLLPWYYMCRLCHYLKRMGWESLESSQEFEFWDPCTIPLE